MDCFLETMETIPEGLGFTLFGKLHLTWLFAFMVATVLCSFWYQRLSSRGRKRWKVIVAALLLVDELFKTVILFVGGNYTWTYLPLHLCSVNIFLIAWHAVKPSKLLGSFLYTICIPGAIAALLFPSWASLPVSSALHIHSFTVHILLAMYPIVLTAAGEIRPSVKQLPLCMLLLVLLAIPIYGINMLLGTNFMFLMRADPGNPLYWFGQNWGSHLLGFPVIIAGVLLVMYLPVELYHKYKNE